VSVLLIAIGILLTNMGHYHVAGLHIAWLWQRVIQLTKRFLDIMRMESTVATGHAAIDAVISLCPCLRECDMAHIFAAGFIYCAYESYSITGFGVRKSASSGSMTFSAPCWHARSLAHVSEGSPI
jgi:hypothetical protein